MSISYTVQQLSVFLENRANSWKNDLDWEEHLVQSFVIKESCSLC